MQTVPPSGHSAVGMMNQRKQDRLTGVYFTYTAVCARLAELKQIRGSESHYLFRSNSPITLLRGARSSNLNMP